MSDFHNILKNRNFFFLWLGQIVSQFGDRLDQMALIAFIHSRSRGSAFELAKVISFTILPSFLISPWAGAYVDRWNRKYTMIISDILRAVLVLLIPLFFFKTDSLVPLYSTVFFVFSISCFFLPSKFSIIPDLVPKERLLMANSLANTTMILAAVVGIGLGGPLIEKVGAKVGFYIDSATYLFSAILLSLIMIKDDRKAKDLNSPDLPLLIKTSIVIDIKEGIKYVFSHAQVRFVFLTIFMLMSAAGAIYISGIVFIQKSFGSVTKDLGLLSIFLGLGFFLGAIFWGRYGHQVPRVKIIFLNLILSGIFIGNFAIFLRIYPAITLAVILATGIGLTIAPIFISSNTLIHEVINAQMRGRIFSSLGMVMNLGFLIFMFLASKLSEFFDPMWVIIAIAFCFVFYGLCGLLRFADKGIT